MGETAQQVLAWFQEWPGPPVLEGVDGKDLQRRPGKVVATGTMGTSRRLGGLPLSFTKLSVAARGYRPRSPVRHEVMISAACARRDLGPDQSCLLVWIAGGL